jgi:hypothetical protein
MKHKIHSMHQNSLAAYYQEQDKLAGRALLIWTVLLAQGAMTDRQLMEDMGFTDPNAVRPRLTELCKAHWCYEAGNINCHSTGKRVRLVAARSREERNVIISRLVTPQLELFKAA